MESKPKNCQWHGGQHGLKQEFSVPKLAAQLRSELDAYLLLEDLRWGEGGPESCPKCGAVGRQYFLNPANGTSRKTRTGKASERRVWKCGHSRKQYSVLTDSIFHGTKISIRTWLLVIFEVCASKNSVSTWEISRKYEVTNETAWHMLHRIREAMKYEPVAGLLGHAVQVDETWIGGQPKNRHRRSKTGRSATTAKADPQTRQRGEAYYIGPADGAHEPALTFIVQESESYRVDDSNPPRFLN